MKFLTIISTIVLFLLPGLVFAGGWQEGWVEMEQGDTLFGKVKIHSWNYHRQVRFLEGKKKEDTIFHPDDVRSFGNDQASYRSMVVPYDQTGVRSRRFGKMVKKGGLKIYQTRYLYEGCDCGGGATEKKGFLLRKPEGAIFLVRKKDWRNRIANPEETADFLQSIDKELAKDIRKGEVKFKEIAKQ